MASGNWTFFTNHAHLLLGIPKDPDVRLRDAAHQVGITARSDQRIVAELEEAGYLRHEKVGRRNRYQIIAHRPLRHPIEAHVEVAALLAVLEPQAVSLPVLPADRRRT